MNRIQKQAQELARKHDSEGCSRFVADSVAINRAVKSADWQQYLRAYRNWVLSVSSEDARIFEEHCREFGFFDGYTDQKIEEFWQG